MHSAPDPAQGSAALYPYDPVPLRGLRPLYPGLWGGAGRGLAAARPWGGRRGGRVPHCQVCGGSGWNLGGRGRVSGRGGRGTLIAQRHLGLSAAARVVRPAQTGRSERVLPEQDGPKREAQRACERAPQRSGRPKQRRRRCGVGAQSADGSKRRPKGRSAQRAETRDATASRTTASAVIGPDVPWTPPDAAPRHLYALAQTSLRPGCPGWRPR